ncbi:MAG: hypothetical protein C4527_10510 [Candidatus Omnitrophota bacterium]|jgi:hypothetical protein|nr:MAG: hypothetical protein C4527_10510 [Candidatus Omnitrophota bacterium]
MKKLFYWPVFILIVMSLQAWAWEFNEAGNREGWQKNGAIQSIEVRDGKLIVQINAGSSDPFINGPTGPFDGDRITGIEMKMKWSYDAFGSGGLAVYYFPAAGSHGSANYEVIMPNEWNIIYIDLVTARGGDSPMQWGGEINSLRVDFADNVQENYTVEIDWIRLVDDHILNNNFEFGGLDSWEHIGEGNMNQFTVTDSEFYSEYFCVEVAGLGSSRYQGLSQDIFSGLDLEKGSSVAVVGAALIPAGAWDANSQLWFRINESNGTTENLSPPIAVTVFDDWFEFESRLTLKYEPAERKKLAVELYSKNPSGQTFYFDDIFVDIMPPKEEVEYWAWSDANWEFNTDGNTNGWTVGNGVATLEAFNGNLVATITAGTNDPYIEAPRGPYNADKMGGIAARMRISSGMSLGGYNNYWFPMEGGHANQTWSVPVEGEWFVVYQNLSEAWDGWFNYIRYDFGDFSTVDYTVEIDWIRFLDESIKNNGFEDTVGPWRHEGAGSIGDFALSTAQKFSGASALEIKGIGSDQYHAVVQDIADGLTIPKGATVTLKGYYYVPSGSWDANSHIWLRVQEWNGVTENNVGSITAPAAFDQWIPFEHSLRLQFDPQDRIQMAIQLYSKTPAGTSIYVDDVFCTVFAAPPQVGWPVNAVKLAAGQRITIDGVVSPGEYEGAQPMIINEETLAGIADPYFPDFVHGGVNNPQYAKPTSLNDFNAAYYFMWDDEFFYAAVSVQDDNYSFVGPDPNGSDTLQFVFAETPDEADTNWMYIPTIAPDDGSGNISAKNAFGGWITHDIMPACDYAANVDPSTQDWSVEIRIPWSSMQGDFSNEVFPPSVGDMVGFCVLAIDYDNGALDWFAGNHTSFPWEGAGVERLFFIERPTATPNWSIY